MVVDPRPLLYRAAGFAEMATPDGHRPVMRRPLASS